MVQILACNPLSASYAGPLATRLSTVLLDARNVAHFGAWSFAWTVWWNIATYTTALGAQGNEGDVRSVEVGTISSSLTRDVSDTPDPRCGSAPPAEGKLHRAARPANGNAPPQLGWQI